MQAEAAFQAEALRETKKERHFWFWPHFRYWPIPSKIRLNRPSDADSLTSLDRVEVDAMTGRQEAGKALRSGRRKITAPRSGVTKADTITYRASAHDCNSCPFEDAMPSEHVDP